MWTVSFVVNLLVTFRGLVGRFLDSAVDVILRHVLSLALLNQCTETGVGIRVGSAVAGCYSDFFTEFSECTGHMTPAFQFGRFAIFKCASHNECLVLMFSYLLDYDICTFFRDYFPR